MATKLNEMSLAVLDWIREMDGEPGGTLRDHVTISGEVVPVEEVAPRMEAAFVLINMTFLAAAPSFLREAFQHCSKQVDWPGIVKTRFAEMDGEE